MSFLFGGVPLTVSELSRKYKVSINRQIRELEREIQKQQQEEKQLFHEMKKHAKTNPKVALQKAKAVVRVRRIVSKFSTMHGNLQALGAKVSNMRSIESLGHTMQEVSKLMSQFHQSAAIKTLPRSLAGFARDNQELMAKTEIMEETLDEVFDASEDEETECDDLVADVLLEAGLDLPPVAYKKTVDEELEAKFQRLKVEAGKF